MSAAIFTLAQLLDGLTYSPATELNGLVTTLGDTALTAKLLLIVAVLAVAYAIGQTRYRYVRGVLLLIGSVTGLVGFVSNGAF